MQSESLRYPGLALLIGLLDFDVGFKKSGTG